MQHSRRSSRLKNNWKLGVQSSSLMHYHRPKGNKESERPNLPVKELYINIREYLGEDLLNNDGWYLKKSMIRFWSDS